MTREEALYDFLFGEEFDEDLYEDLEEAIEGEITASYNNSFEADNGEYEVVTDSEADGLAEERVNDLLDDVGVFGLSDYTTQWVIDNALTTDWFEEAQNESNEFYVEDIESETPSDSDRFINRLHEEMYDEDVIDLELEYDDDDEVMNEDEVEKKVEDSKWDFVQKLNNNYDDPIEWYKDNFGSEAVSEVAKKHDLVDTDEVVEMIIETDGRGHVISSYDGEEYENDRYYIYRTN